jgi:hypothetical protein
MTGRPSVQDEAKLSPAFKGFLHWCLEPEADNRPWTNDLLQVINFVNFVKLDN